MGGPATLITGFPGFIAGRLVERLLQLGSPPERFFFLVQPSFVEAARSLCVRIEQQAPSFVGRWELVEGDLRHEGLGLSPSAVERLREEVGSLWHLAALYDLTVPEALAREVNVEGTRRVLDLCERLPRFEVLHYVSTCFVAGARSGVAFEEELDVGQGFHNHYEATKHAAEVLVRDRMGTLPTTILRPAIVVGDSRTGETVKGDGPYFAVRLYGRFPRWFPMVHFGRGAGPFQAVSVDYIVETMARISELEAARGRTFHLSDPDPLSVRRFFELVLAATGRRPAIATVPMWFVDLVLAVGPLRRFLGVPRELGDYLRADLRFDTAHVRELLPDVRCPGAEEYIPPCVRYALEHPEIFR